MTTRSPLSPAVRSILCSHEVSNRSVPSSHSGWFVSGLAMAFPHDFANRFVPRSFVSPFGLELENILGDHGVSLQASDEMLALEVETYHRCFPAQPALSALQRYNRRKCAFDLRDLAAAAHLPPHGALFSQQLLGSDSLDRNGRYRH